MIHSSWRTEQHPCIAGSNLTPPLLTEATGLPGFEESSPSCVISNLQRDFNQRTNHRRSFILNDDYYLEDNYKQEVKGFSC